MRLFFFNIKHNSKFETQIDFAAISLQNKTLIGKEEDMATLEAGMTREDAFALLTEHNKEPFHIEHA